MWNYPMSSFLRLIMITPPYTEREKKTVIISVFHFTGECGKEDRASRQDK